MLSMKERALGCLICMRERLLQSEEFINKCQKMGICTICTNIYFFVEIWRNVKTKLSTLKKGKNVIKSSFPQSYPHYPQKTYRKVWITLAKKRTNVLYIYHKNQNLSKKNHKNLDF